MPRRPQRSRKASSPSPRRVPPDQSGTASPAATSARSGSRWRSGRVTWVSRVPRVKTSTGSPVAAVGVREPEQGVGVGAHRAGDVDQQHDPARPGAAAAPARSGRAPPSGAAARAACARASTAPRRRRRVPVRAAGAARAGAARANIAASRARSALLSDRDVAVAQHLGRAGLAPARRPRRRRPGRRPPVAGVERRPGPRCAARRGAGARCRRARGRTTRRTPGRSARGRPARRTASPGRPSRRRLVVEADRRDRLEVGALAVGGDGHPGGAQGAGEAEQHLVGAWPCTGPGRGGSSGQDPVEGGRTRSASSRYFTATPSVAAAVSRSRSRGAELVQRPGPVEGLGDPGRLETLRRCAAAGPTRTTCAGEGVGDLGRAACGRSASSRSRPGWSIQW